MRIILAIIALAAIFVTVVLIRTCGEGGDGSGTSQSGQLTTAPPIDTEPSGSASATAPGPEGRLVGVGGHRLYVRTYGDGAPAVVIEPGIGDAGRVWGSVVEVLAEETRVVLYDRAGYGQSEPGPMPRSADRVVRELTALLVSTPVEPPYVLLGHSLGAVHALVYAAENPNLVAGLVLLDPPPIGFMKGERFPDLHEMAEEMTAGFRRDAQQASAAGNERQAAFLETVASEHEMMFETGWALVGSIKSLGDLPLVVIASGVPNPEFGASAAEFQRYWRESSEALSRISTRGRFVFVENSTHNLPGDAPDAVVDAVLYCIAESEADTDSAIWQGEK
jgi:pimeloyl-ACP methyl ester carboxylesterase